MRQKIDTKRKFNFRLSCVDKAKSLSLKIFDFILWALFGIYLLGGLGLGNKIYFGYMNSLFAPVGILGILLALWGVDFSQSLFFGTFILDLPQGKPSYRHTRILRITVGTYLISFYLLLPLLRFWSFGTWFWDLGGFQQVIWRLTHGFGPTSTAISGSIENPLSYFPNNHLNFWVFPIGAIFKLFPYTETLLILQSLCLLLALYILKKIGESLLKPFPIPVNFLPYLLWFWFPFHKINIWDLHETAFLFVFGLLAFLFYLKKKNYLAALFLLFMAMWKEDAWVVVV